jgi:hypothetical protein
LGWLRYAAALLTGVVSPTHVFPQDAPHS